MPWKYVMPNDVDSLRVREATLNRASEFWAQFVSRIPEIEAHCAGDASWDCKDWIDRHLGAVHPRLRWEFGRDLNGPYFVVTCESAHHLRPMVDSILRRAPELPTWTFREYRASFEPEEIPSRVRAQTGHIMGSTTVQARMGQHRQIDFVFQSLLAGSNEEAAMEVAQRACDYLLGEDVVARWGGHLDVVEMSHSLANSFIPLARVRSMVLELITTVLSDLPDRPYWRMPKLVEIESKYRPEKREEYGRQDDAMFGTTVIPELREAAFQPGFDSARFSRLGETFCYLKIRADDVGIEDRYKRKKLIEESMDAALREDGVGAVVGTATGRKYLYFDLAVVDVVKTLEITRRRLLALEVLPVHSWLMFFDATLAGEYIGLRSATPRPPMWAEPEEPVPVKPTRPFTPPPTTQSSDAPADPLSLLDPLV